ncbi:MaoC/PaaZ C-terminal domain-containing protein [Conexibacter sp. DBS9H8]|uniref:MaoC/PaaZ C-terminal domain-containing protein n=1 Tax=Conexibacter sp. DBS9H8 TaxID=2937801 RepID=UPI00200D3A3F|nr:MaoC/PaaZ C-terminal domain-containing protein [Conexibacter sp. DBS9H8]
MAEIELGAAPNPLGLIARAGLGALPVPVPGLSARRSADVSGDVLVLERVDTDLGTLAAFSRLCGYTLERAVPLTWPHIPAFALQMAILTDPRFPFPAVGLVHISNAITQHRPILTSERLTLRVWAEPIVDHPRGRAVPIRTEARVGDELVWEETAINLRIGRRNDAATAPEVASSEGYAPAARWRLPADLGRRYAAVAGDYNPIHLHPLSARALGFPRAIAHGFWTKSRALAQLQGRLPGAVGVEVAFKRPILLPATVRYVESLGEDAGIGFGVRAIDNAPHLDGYVTY